MKLGVRAHDYGKYDATKLANILKKEGFESVQLAIPRAIEGINSYEEITIDVVRNIKQAFDDTRIEIGIMSCYQDLANPDKETRQKATNTFKRCLKLNTELKAGAVGTETSYAHLSKFEKNRTFLYMIDSLFEIAEEAEKLNVDFAIEPVAWHPLSDIETTLEVIEKINSKHLKVIFDLANVLEKPEIINQTNYWKGCFDDLGKYITAIHLKDFRIENDRYVPLPLGEGCLDYTELIKFLKKNPEIPVMREEMMMEFATQDIKFMKTML